MKKNINEIRKAKALKAIDRMLLMFKTVSIFLFVFVIYLIFSETSPVEAKCEVKTERISVSQMAKHDMDISYKKWVVKKADRVLDGSVENQKYRIDVSESDIDLMARVVMSEASICSTDTKQAVATTIINRVLDETHEHRNLKTVSDVVNAKNQYSTQDNGEPTDECYEAVYAALSYDNAFPEDMVYFRTGKYHRFGTEYAPIDNMYFSCY